LDDGKLKLINSKLPFTLEIFPQKGYREEIFTPEAIQGHARY
jgi:hypothetical protein